jgi:tRNA threonylcarbamoyladenosine biosynthesis protein TsaB
VIVLGIETSTIHGGVALLADDRLLASYTLSVEVTHSERLLPAIDRALGDAGLALKDLSGLAVAIGPGSFTGLRIGLSTAKGLAATTGLPLAGVPTLEAMAWAIPFAICPVCPMLDARKAEVYAGIFRHGEGGVARLLPEVAIRPEDLVARIEGPTIFLGDGARIHAGLLREALGARVLFPPLALRGGNPALVAELGLARLRRGEADPLERLAPMYLRPPEAEVKRAAALGGRP